MTRRAQATGDNGCRTDATGSVTVSLLATPGVVSISANPPNGAVSATLSDFVCVLICCSVANQGRVSQRCRHADGDGDRRGGVVALVRRPHRRADYRQAQLGPLRRHGDRQLGLHEPIVTGSISLSLLCASTSKMQRRFVVRAVHCRAGEAAVRRRARQLQARRRLSRRLPARRCRHDAGAALGAVFVRLDAQRQSCCRCVVVACRLATSVRANATRDRDVGDDCGDVWRQGQRNGQGRSVCRQLGERDDRARRSAGARGDAVRRRRSALVPRAVLRGPLRRVSRSASVRARPNAQLCASVQ